MALWQGHISKDTPLPFGHTRWIGSFPGFIAAPKLNVQGIGQSQRQEWTDAHFDSEDTRGMDCWNKGVSRWTPQTAQWEWIIGPLWMTLHPPGGYRWSLGEVSWAAQLGKFDQLSSTYLAYWDLSSGRFPIILSQSMESVLKIVGVLEK